MKWLVSAAGSAIVLLVLRDIYRTLWRPSGHGGLTRALMRALWWASRRLQRRQQRTSGPLAVGVVVLTWLFLVIAGGALVYWPHLPESFSYAAGLDPDSRSAAVDATYLSAVSVATLGFGDIVPRAGWLRLVAPVQAITGFAVLTATVSWALQVYPALSRQRALALRLSTLRQSKAGSALAALDSTVSADLLLGISDDLGAIRVDLAQYPETYYYRGREAVTALPAMLPQAVEFAEVCSTADRPDVQFAAGVLRRSLSDFCALLRQEFDHSGSDREVLCDYADSHGYLVAGDDRG